MAKDTDKKQGRLDSDLPSYEEATGKTQRLYPDLEGMDVQPSAPPRKDEDNPKNLDADIEAPKASKAKTNFSDLDLYNELLEDVEKDAKQFNNSKNGAPPRHYGLAMSVIRAIGQKDNDKVVEL